MAHLLVVILEDLNVLPDLLDAWKRIGVPGVTLWNSVGGYQAENWLRKMGLGGLSRLLGGESQQRTIISLIDDEHLLEQAIAEADEIVQGFDRPHNGILFVLPVTRAIGIHKWTVESEEQARREEEARTGLLKRERMTYRDLTVADIMDVLHLDPAIVPADAAVAEIIKTMLDHPNVQVACVVNEEQRLVGVIDVPSLADAFLVTVFPEEFMSAVQDLAEAEEFARWTRMHQASDIMREPVYVHISDSVRAAFHAMHQAKLPGIPVVDEQYRVIGYINLLELMGLCLESSTNAGGDQ